MKNPKNWQATPYDHDGLNDHSSSGRSEGKSSNSRGHAHPTRSEKMTPVSHKAATPASEAWDPIPGSTQTHPLLGVKSEEMSGHVGDGRMVGAPKSGQKTLSMDAKNSQAKPWHKRNYDMQGGHGVATGGGTMRKKH